MQNNYPSPCLKCTNSTCRQCGNYYKACAAYRTWFCWQWKRLRTHLSLLPVKPQVSSKFCYIHPDQVRRYLQKSPCEVCSAEQTCNVPC